jgi:DNA-binding Lrp family transcriptional regulator
MGEGLMYAFLLVQVSPGTEQKIKDRIEHLPEVREAHNTIGGWNVFVKLEVNEMADAGRFVKKYVICEDVLETRTLFLAEEEEDDE